MPITLNGDTGLSGVAGTASAPAFVGTDTDTGVYYSAANTLDFATGGTAAAQLDSSQNLKFNSGYGSVATAYGCRAWVNFNGTGTIVINASGNVTSITDNGTSDYTVNFTNAMPDANYAVCSIGYHKVSVTEGSMAALQGSQASGSVRIQYRGNAGSPDPETVQIAVFR